jgi:ABC-type antimicrobial peptide transport system permease subunit
MEWLSRDLWYLVRTRVAPANVLAPIRTLVARRDPSLPLAQAQPLTAVVERAQAQAALTLRLLLLAALVGLLLGVVGLYGVISRVTAQRRREIGLRMALGAEAGAVRAMVVAEGMRVVLLGLLVGLVAALLLARFAGTLLYTVSATDPATYLVVSSLLAAVALLAVWLPARRAAGVSPLVALRGE